MDFFYARFVKNPNMRPGNNSDASIFYINPNMIRSCALTSTSKFCIRYLNDLPHIIQPASFDGNGKPFVLSNFQMISNLIPGSKQTV